MYTTASEAKTSHLTSSFNHYLKDLVGNNMVTRVAAVLFKENVPAADKLSYTLWQGSG